MLSREKLEEYRRMTTSQRLALTFQMMREDWPRMFDGTPEQVTRRFERIRRENNLRNKNMLEALARCKLNDGRSDQS